MFVQMVIQLNVAPKKDSQGTPKLPGTPGAGSAAESSGATEVEAKPAAHDLFAQHDLIDVAVAIPLPAQPLAPVHVHSVSPSGQTAARKTLNLEDYKRKRGLI